jgi:hypothetical protein
MKHFSIIFLWLAHIVLNAQTSQIGNHFVGVSSNGSLFRSPSGQPLLEAPMWSGLTTIFESQFWVGYTKNGQKHGIMPLISSPGISNQSTFGPHCNDWAYQPFELSQKFNKTWTVYQDSVNFHVANYQMPSYAPPTCVSSYLAVGDTSKGVHPYLLPFKAALQDNNYSWQRGDMPVISGNKSLFALYSDRNIAKGPDNQETSLNVSVELYQSPLASTSDAHANSIFARFRVTNIGTETIDSLLVGLVADFDIGVAENDYVGTDVARNFIYGMNYVSAEPINGYGPLTPAMGVLALGNDILRTVRYNPGVTQLSAQSTPTNIHQEFNYLKGIAPDGSILPQFYANGDPLIKFGALDDTLVVNFIDRAMIMALPIQDLASNATKCFDFAYVFAQGQDHKQSLEYLRLYCDQIKAEYDSAGSTSCTIAQFLGNSEHDAQTPKLYPNPVTDFLNIDFEYQDVVGGLITITNQHGQLLGTTELVPNEQVKRMDVSEFPAGIYYLEVRSRHNRSIYKFVKM